MKESFSIKFYLNTAKIRDVKQQIYVRVIVEREKIEMATKLFVDPNQWNEENGRTKRAASINDELSEIENEIRKVRRRIIDDNKKLSAKLLKQYYKGEKNFKVKLLEYFKNHVNELEQFANADTISPATVTTTAPLTKRWISF